MAVTVGRPSGQEVPAVVGTAGVRSGGAGIVGGGVALGGGDGIEEAARPGESTALEGGMGSVAGEGGAVTPVTVVTGEVVVTASSVVVDWPARAEDKVSVPGRNVNAKAAATVKINSATSDETPSRRRRLRADFHRFVVILAGATH